MPKETFFRLSEAKQKRILEAAREEFSNKSLKETSIANIIKLADIPRGSFYQYFDGMEDLYYYYFAYIRKNNQLLFDKVIAKNNGDLFKAYDDYFSISIEGILKGDYASYYKHLFLSMDDKAMQHVSKDFSGKQHSAADHPRQAGERDAHSLVDVSMIDKQQLRMTTEEELGELVHIIMHFLFSTVIKAYRRENITPEENIERAKFEFRRKLDWLKNGVAKQEESD